MSLNEAFNGDPYVVNEVLDLIDAFKVKVAVETGTSTGLTTRFLSTTVDAVHSIEIMEDTYRNTKTQIEAEALGNVHLHLGNSPEVLDRILRTVDREEGPILFYLDAHWYDYWPILDELQVIGYHCRDNAVIVIDDFMVPGSTLDYDSYNGRALDYEFVRPYLDTVYSEYRYHYNSDVRTGGARRGKLYVYPASHQVPGDRYVVPSGRVGRARIWQETGHCFGITLPEYSRVADTMDEPSVSRLRLTEDGVPLSGPHSIHDDIRTLGQGRFSHWHGTLYFSTSDNTDPRTNGRVYSFDLGH